MNRNKRGVGKNTMLRACMVYDVVKQHYERGRQDRCLLWVYRNKVNKIYPMSVATFWRYLRLAERTKGKLGEDKQ